MLDQSQAHAKQLEMAADTLKNGSLAQLEQKLKDQTQELEELKKKLNTQEQKTILGEEEIKNKLHEALKQAAIKDQKIEF